MRAIHIKATARLVEEVDIAGDLKSLQESVGGYITGVQLPNGEVLYVDEEALIKKGPEDQSFFSFDGLIFAGDGLIIGLNRRGRSQSSRSELFDIIHRVQWVNAHRLIAEAKRREKE